jgi:acetoin utilization deacetylase AcuC-like enzyme
VKAFYSDQFVLPLPEGHRFPMEKYRLLRERVVAEGLVALQELIVPHAATDEEILRVHDPEYLRRIASGEMERAEMRRIGFPWSPEMVERSRRSAGGTIEACRAALGEGAAANLAGGTHHSFRDRGEGYCVFNDAAIAARALQAEGRVGRVLVVDCDVHQGNGTAAIFRDDPTVFTFSIHGRNNFPFHKERSDLDVELEDGTADAEYLAALAAGLARAVPAARADLAIYVSRSPAPASWRATGWSSSDVCRRGSRGCRWPW